MWHEEIKKIKDGEIKDKEIKMPRYQVLVILTDGPMSDLEYTLKQIVNSSHLPMSIVMIGIGATSSQFEQLEKIENDAAHLYSKILQKYAQRDIVNFCTVRHHKIGK